MNHILAASPLMQVIDILSDDSELGHIACEFSDSNMSTVGLRLDNLLAAPFIPSPTQRWVGSECFTGGQLSCIKSLPEPSQRIPECWDTAFG
jgi:hypothetical protein